MQTEDKAVALNYLKRMLSGKSSASAPEFTQDWTTNKLDLWFPILEPVRHRRVSILEAGTFEGRTARALLDYMPNSTITCIDTFKLREVEERFDRNLAPYGDRVKKMKGAATVMLERLRRRHASFDLVYLDCAKDRTGAFVVSALGWHLLKVGGIAIWDDLNWRGQRKPSERAAPGSKLFIRTFWPSMEVLHHPDANPKWSGQFIARKTSDDWPEHRLPEG